MTTEPHGRELTDAEWRLIQEQREKVPLHWSEIDFLRDEGIPWIKEKITSEDLSERTLDQRAKVRESRIKLFQVIFGAAAATATVIGGIISFLHLK